MSVDTGPPACRPSISQPIPVGQSQQDDCPGRELRSARDAELLRIAWDMAFFESESVLRVHHWNERLFSFATTRRSTLRFESGHFVMMGLEVEGRPLMRAYSIASPAWADHLEFLSIKVPDGALTSRLQNLRAGDEVLVGRKPTGTLVLSDLLPGRRLFLFGTGTGLAPFMSIVRDPETYERFETVVLVHGVRHVSELAYGDYIENDIRHIEALGEEIGGKLLYYPTVTREPFRNQGRITMVIANGRLCADLGLPPLDAETDRAMICGSPEVLKDVSAQLEKRHFRLSRRTGEPADYVIERSFVERG
jgi:ferredoxin--NADP+ reductase